MKAIKGKIEEGWQVVSSTNGEADLRSAQQGKNGWAKALRQKSSLEV